MSDKKMTPAEFAGKLEKAYENEGYLYGAIAKCLEYGEESTTIEEDVERLIDAIRNLDVQEDCIPYPLDMDGVPCKIDNDVYYKNKKIFIEYCNSEYIVYSDEKGYLHEVAASYVTHKKTRTLEDIKDEATDFVIAFEEADGLNRTEKLEKLIEEAHELGRKAAENDR